MARFYRRSPDQLTAQEIEKYLVYLQRDRRLAWNSCNVARSALRFLYVEVLDRPEMVVRIPERRSERHLPDIWSVEEVKEVVDSAVRPRDHALLMTAYGGGFRVSELVALKPCHIESARHMIRVEQGKGRKDRYTILPDRLLAELRAYWKICHPKEWVFPGHNPSRPMCTRVAERIFNRAKAKAGMTRGKGIHMLRHCFCTHMLEAGYDIFEVKEMMGHRSLETTMLYRHVTAKRMAELRSPLDSGLFA